MKKSQTIYLSLLLLAAVCIASCENNLRSNLRASRVLTSDKTPISYGSSLVVTSNSTTSVTWYPEYYLGDLNSTYLILESDCNLVLYDNGVCTWTSNTSQADNNPNCNAVFQADGNFVIYLTTEFDCSSETTYSTYDSEAESESESESACTSSDAIWSSGTNNQFDTTILQLVDGHLQIVGIYIDGYSVTIDISHPPSHQTPDLHLVSDSPSVVVKCTDDDFIMQEQDYLGDLNATYLALQDDCNLVLYDQGQPLWGTDTQRSVYFTCELALTKDGNIMIYAKDDPNVVFWSSNQTTSQDANVVSSELRVDDQVMNLVHTLGDGSTVTYNTWSWGSLEEDVEFAEEDEWGSDEN